MAVVEKFKSAGVGLLWVFGYLFLNSILWNVFPSWGSIELAILTDVIVSVFGYLYYRKLKQRMMVSEDCRYEILPAVGKFLVIYTLWFCAYIIGNVIALVVPDEGLAEHVAVQSANPVLFMSFSIFVAPVLEEILFRGIVYTKFKVFGSMFLAAVSSAVIFGLMHGTMAQFFIGVCFGIGQCFLYEYTRDLRWTIGLHFLVNVSNYVIASMAIPIDCFLNGPLLLFLFVVIVVATLVVYPIPKRKMEVEA